MWGEREALKPTISFHPPTTNIAVGIRHETKKAVDHNIAISLLQRIFHPPPLPHNTLTTANLKGNKNCNILEYKNSWIGVFNVRITISLIIMIMTTIWYWQYNKNTAYDIDKLRENKYSLIRVSVITLSNVALSKITQNLVCHLIHFAN